MTDKMTKYVIFYELSYIKKIKVINYLLLYITLKTQYKNVCDVKNTHAFLVLIYNNGYEYYI